VPRDMLVKRVKEWLSENENIKNLRTRCGLDSLGEFLKV